MSRQGFGGKDGSVSRTAWEEQPEIGMNLSDAIVSMGSAVLHWTFLETKGCSAFTVRYHVSHSCHLP